jgi:NADH-quinone oxidoreductase subunit A
VETFNLLNLILYAALVVIVPIALCIVAKILSISEPSSIKNATYECGQVFTGKAHLRFTIHYYPYAVIYAVFGAFAIFMLIVAPEILRLRLALEYGFIVFAIIILALFSAILSLKPGE